MTVRVMGLLAGLLDVVFPPSCIGCTQIGSGLCAQCAPVCTAIVEPLGGVNIRAVGAYEGILRRAILAVKDGRRDVARSLGLLLAARIAIEEVLVPVPTTRIRRWARGFDQAHLLACVYASKRGNPVLDALECTGGRAQHGRSRSERISAPERFRVREPSRVTGQSLVLVDDVVTTGATLRACAAALQGAGARVCGAVALARTLPEG